MRRRQCTLRVMALLGSRGVATVEMRLWGGGGYLVVYLARIRVVLALYDTLPYNGC